MVILTDSKSAPRLEDLASRLGKQRTLEARLSGGFLYAPCRQQPSARCAPAPMSNSERKALVKKIVSFQKSLKSQRLPRSQILHALGVSLVFGPTSSRDREKAIKFLQMATKEKREGRISNDLAAVYLARFQEQRDPADLLRALSAVDSSLRLLPSLPEARFNRALILENLFLRNEARAAWVLYRSIDGYSSWSEEAKQHLAELSKPVADDVCNEKIRLLGAATPSDYSLLARKLVNTSSQRAREYAIEDLLGNWGDAFLAGEQQKADHYMKAAEEISGYLFRSGGDQTAWSIVGSVGKAARGEDLKLLRRLASGLRSFQRGSKDWNKLEIEAADFELNSARRDLSGTPVGLWAEVGIAGAYLYKGRYNEALRNFYQANKKVDSKRFPSIAGRIEWGIGITRARQGLLGDSLRHYIGAANHFSMAKEQENWGAVLALMAENFRLLGQDEHAWKLRYEASSKLFEFPASRRLHNLLWESAEAARESGRLGVALVFQDEGVKVAERSKEPTILAEALIRRSRVRAGVGMISSAIRDLKWAEQQNQFNRSEVTSGRVALDIALAKGEIIALNSPSDSLKLFDQAVEGYRLRRVPLNLATALLGRARARLAKGMKFEAQDDLLSAAQLFEEQYEALRDEGLGLSYAEAARGIFDELIMEQVRSGELLKAFEVSERAHRTLAGEKPLKKVTVRSLAHDLVRLPARVALVEYVLVENHLLIWIVCKNGIFFVDRDVDPRYLTRKIDAFIEGVRLGRATTEDVAVSKELYDLLIPEQVRYGLDNIVFVSDKALNGVPFAALRNPHTGRFLVESSAVSVVPSIAFYFKVLGKEVRRGRAVSPVLIVGDPAFDRLVFPAFTQLLGARAEVTAIKSVYVNAEVLQGAQATKSRFINALEQSEILHFAGHSVYDPSDTYSSFLILSPSFNPVDDGILFARSLQGLHLGRLRLVVLSACDSAQSRNTHAGNLSGLVRPLLAAGASAVLGSLWRVDDRRSVALLSAFHRSRLVTGSSSRALHEAQIEALRSPDPSVRSPSNWAAYQLIGFDG